MPRIRDVLKMVVAIVEFGVTLVGSHHDPQRMNATTDKQVNAIPAKKPIITATNKEANVMRPARQASPKKQAS
jgi:hypothetical protein